MIVEYEGSCLEATMAVVKESCESNKMAIKVLRSEVKYWSLRYCVHFTINLPC